MLLARANDFHIVASIYRISSSIKSNWWTLILAQVLQTNYGVINLFKLENSKINILYLYILCIYCLHVPRYRNYFIHKYQTRSKIIHQISGKETRSTTLQNHDSCAISTSLCIENSVVDNRFSSYHLYSCHILSSYQKNPI